MRIAAGMASLLVMSGVLLAADQSAVTIKPGGSASVEVGQTVRFAYPYDAETMPSFRGLLLEKSASRYVVGLKEVHTGPADKGENNVIFQPRKTGTFQVEVAVFVGPRENGRTTTYNYTLVVKKKDQ